CEGQLRGGVAQVVAGALWEARVYDAQAQPLTQSWLEYAMPTAEQTPPIRIVHVVTPSPLNALGVKGVGEGGSMAPPAAIAAAVEDALRPFAARVVATPLGSEEVHRLLQAPAP